MSRICSNSGQNCQENSDPFSVIPFTLLSGEASVDFFFCSYQNNAFNFQLEEVGDE